MSPGLAKGRSMTTLPENLTDQDLLDHLQAMDDYSRTELIAGLDEADTARVHGLLHRESEDDDPDLMSDAELVMTDDGQLLDGDYDFYANAADGYLGVYRDGQFVAYASAPDGGPQPGDYGVITFTVGVPGTPQITGHTDDEQHQPEDVNDSDGSDLGLVPEDDPYNHQPEDVNDSDGSDLGLVPEDAPAPVAAAPAPAWEADWDAVASLNHGVVARIVARDAGADRSTTFMQLPGGEFLFGSGHDVNLVATATGGSGTLRFNRNRLSANDFVIDDSVGDFDREELRDTIRAIVADDSIYDYGDADRVRVK
jgi:hypothetical protein